MFIDPFAKAYRPPRTMLKLRKHSRATPGSNWVMFNPHTSWADMALLTEGEKRPLGIYKHGPPGGGRKAQTASLCGTTSPKATNPTFNDTRE